MGRRKIEIRAIKDDRNRSVTFLKRKGGLFKKAHELSVLCSVDVAVVIFGHNKKLYEYCSGDMNEILGRYQYFGGAHERKGPADFIGKGNGEEEDEDEDNAASPPPDAYSPPQPEHPAIPSQFQNHRPDLQHVRQQAPSASPPVPNGPFQPRRPTPQPQNISRPSSRNDLHPSHVHRASLNPLAHHLQQISQPGPPQPPYHFMPNNQVYHAQAAQNIPQSRPPVQQHPSPQPPQYALHPQPQHHQMQHAFLEEQRRQSMPPSFPHQERTQQALSVSTPPQPEQRTFQTPQVRDSVPQQAGFKSHSIFTPIEESRSLLAQHWGSTKNAEASRTEPTVKTETGMRSQSVDVGAMLRTKTAGVSPQPTRHSRLPQSVQSVSSSSTPSIPNFAPPPRTNSVQSDPKRPRLKVQIPSEQSDGGSATAESSPKDSGNTTTGTPAKSVSAGSAHGSGVVLPPPSPSASTIPSAGAQGPPNPFARPAPPNSNIRSTSQHESNRDIETPISALPSRFVAEGLLPSPSSFYPDWTFGRSGDSNLLPSPLNFHTPVVALGINFKDDDNERKKRPAESEDSGGQNKRLKAEHPV